jgi:hypothetical protein
MTNLSPKAIRFIEIAMAGAEDRGVKAVWDAVDRDIGGPLPDAAARAALTALQQFERQLYVQLEQSASEDESADISNDLGFVFSIKSDLIRQLGGRAA